MTEKFDPEKIKLIRETAAKHLAEQIISVQPMDAPKIFADLLAASTPHSELVEQGYEPVSSMGLLWRKKTTDE
jgi:hypothetical protein